MKRSSDRWLTSMFTLAACFLTLLPHPPMVTCAWAASADSVRFCALVDHEEWLREHPPSAGKRVAELIAAAPRKVRLIYFLPNDRPFRQAVVDSMKVMMRRMQRFFGEQMASHGYGYRTFRYEADAGGEPLVHRVDGEHGDAYYLQNTLRARTEYREAYEEREMVNLFVIDNSTNHIHVPGGGAYVGIGGGSRIGGEAMVGAGFSFETVAHELGHAFSVLWHDFRDSSYIMSWSIQAPPRMSSCTAGQLAVTPWFDPDIPFETPFSEDPTVTFIGPSLWYPPGSTHLTLPFRVSDPDGVHPVVMTYHIPGSRFNANVKACRMMAGQTDGIVEFEVDGVPPHGPGGTLSDDNAHIFRVWVTDGRGARVNIPFGFAHRSPYHLATLEGQSTEGQLTNLVQSLAFSPDGGLLAAGRRDYSVRVWDVAAREEVARLEDHSGDVFAVTFSPDGTVLAADSGSDIQLWDVASREPIATLETSSVSIWDLAFSPDGRLLAAASFDGTVSVCDVASREEIAVLHGHSSAVWSVAFSPDGTLLASGSSDKTIRLWDVASREEIAALEGHWRGVFSVAFSPDGGILASGSADGTVKLWDVASRSEIATLKAYRRSYLKSLAFSPDGGILAAASGHGRVDLWDVHSGRIVETLVNPGRARWIAMSPDGRVLAAASRTWIDVWDTASFTTPRPRVPDWDGDGEVGFADFVKFAARYGYRRGQAGYDQRFDLDDDGSVGFSDFLIVVNAFGTNTST